MSRILPFLEAQDSLADLDGVVCDWIELQWARGESIGIHWLDCRCVERIAFFLACASRNPQECMEDVQILVPYRGPTEGSSNDPCDSPGGGRGRRFGICYGFALGFHCLLRTGEFLALQYKDIEVAETCGIVTLLSSKSGLRTGSEEAVSIRDPLVLNLVRTLITTERFARGQRLWPHSLQFFRTCFERYMRFFRISYLKMKPYSLRRGGATFLLARLYLEDGMAQIPQLRVPSLDMCRLRQYASQCPHALLAMIGSVKRG